MSSTGQLQIGPLVNTVDVVSFVALSGMAWFNAVELLWTILVSFKRWTGRYFYALIVATTGVFLYQLGVFFMIFGGGFNIYAVICCIDAGWASMVTGQSVVLWSRLHLVCRSNWKLKAILYMIIFNAVCLHIPQIAFSIAGIRNGIEDPTYKPFDIMEKICISIFTVQELLISSVYLYETIRILRVGEIVQKKNNRRKIQMLFLANIAIICIDVTTVTLEFLALWGVWCSFKGFGYSVKLKIEFAILNQLRDSVKSGSSNGSGYDPHGHSDHGISLSSRVRRSNKPSRAAFSELDDQEQITKTTEIHVQHTDKSNAFDLADAPAAAPRNVRHAVPGHPPSESSSEIEFATKGV